VENLQSIRLIKKSNSILLRWREILSVQGKSTAIRGEDGRSLRTFEEIQTEAEGFAERLKGLREGVLIIATGNAEQWPGLLLGAWLAGRAVIPSEPLTESSTGAITVP